MHSLKIIVSTCAALYLALRACPNFGSHGGIILVSQMVIIWEVGWEREE